VAGVGPSVGFRVGSSIGVVAPEPGRVRPGLPVSGAGLRSLPAKQHAPKAGPSPATDRGRAWRPACTTSLPAILVASTPGGDIPHR
jgi:hypothetical protein